MPIFEIDPKSWYSASEVARYFDVDTRTVNNWVNEGRLIAIQTSDRGHYRVLGSEINAALERWTVNQSLKSGE